MKEIIKNILFGIFCLAILVAVVYGSVKVLQYGENKYYNSPPTYTYENVEVIYTTNHIEYSGTVAKVEVWKQYWSGPVTYKPLYIITFENGNTLRTHNEVKIRLEW